MWQVGFFFVFSLKIKRNKLRKILDYSLYTFGLNFFVIFIEIFPILLNLDKQLIRMYRLVFFGVFVQNCLCIHNNGKNIFFLFFKYLFIYFLIDHMVFPSQLYDDFVKSKLKEFFKKWIYRWSFHLKINYSLRIFVFLCPLVRFLAPLFFLNKTK